MGENSNIPPPPSGEIVMPKNIPAPPSGDVVMPFKKKEDTTLESPEVSVSESATVSAPLSENGEEDSWFDKAKSFLGKIGENIQSGYGLGGATEAEKQRDIESQRQREQAPIIAKEEQKKIISLADKSILRNNVVNELTNNHITAQDNSRDNNIQELQGLYNQLDQLKNGTGVAQYSEKDILDKIANISAKKVEPREIGVDQYRQPIVKKVPYKTYGEMYDATLSSAQKVNDGKVILDNLNQEIGVETEKQRAKKGFKMTSKDAEGNEIYEMNPMESFVQGVGTTLQTMNIGLHNMTGDKENALRMAKQKYVEDNVLFPKTTGDGIEGTIAKGTEMLGGVMPLMAAAPIGGVGALAMNALLFGASDYGGTLYSSYLEKKQENPDLTDEQAMSEAESNAKFAGAKGLVLGATLPAQGALGNKIFLNNVERGAFKKFLAGQGVMIPAFGSSTAIQNWYEDKPIMDNVGRSMVDAFIIGGMTHALHALPTMSAKVKNTFENGIAKNYGSLATVIDGAVKDGTMDYATAQNIAEKAKAYDVVGKDNAPEVENKLVEQGIELNKTAEEINARKEANPLADVTDLEVKAEEVNKQIHELKGTDLTEKESKEYDALKEKQKDVEKKLTPTEKRKLKHYEKRIATAEATEQAAKEETIKQQEEEKAVETKTEVAISGNEVGLDYKDGEEGKYSDDNVYGDIRIVGNDVEIMDWNSKGTGRGNTEKSLRKLKQKYGGEIRAVDAGYVGETSFKYWEKMMQKGLIDGIYDDNAKLHVASKPQVEPKSEVVVEEVKPTDGKKLFSEPAPDVERVADEYRKKTGIETPKGEKITDIDVEEAKRRADAFDEMKHDPNNPEVKEAYEAMAKETLDQHKDLMDNGYEVEVFEGVGEPYKNSQEMLKDLRENKHLFVLSTEKEFGANKITEQQRNENPLLRDSGFKDKNGKPLLVNDVFRFVHDAFGHGERGNSFGAKGEENAWDVHARMYSPTARRAMTTETRGQNSWVNFGKHLRNEDGTIKKVSAKEKPFAEQKIGLLPEWVSELASEKSQPTEEVTIFAEVNKAKGQAGRDKAFAKFKDRAKAEDVWNNFNDYVGKLKQRAKEGKIEFETDC